ncbi:hypothetical protein DRO61_04655 [Candidatus Bathyarchaeota archaeon]|nr:MAG: hypothetical protein DRO61_04655 [Candidatus Bathyarchaeota archaeon]
MYVSNEQSRIDANEKENRDRREGQEEWRKNNKIKVLPVDFTDIKYKAASTFSSKVYENAQFN